MKLFIILKGSDTFSVIDFLEVYGDNAANEVAIDNKAESSSIMTEMFDISLSDDNDDT